METYAPPRNPTFGRILPIARAMALAVALAASLPQSTHAATVTPPPMPANIQVPAGNKLFLVGRAVGTQNYVCLPSGAGVKYVLFTPQATLFDGRKQITTHAFSPNPDEGGVVRAMWQHARDTSTVWGAAQPGNSTTDPAYVAPGAIPWLLVTVVGSQAGPTGGDKLSATTFIQRLNTAGGVAPSTGCSEPADVGRQAFVPYTTDYFFYKRTA
jgi:hypothetical protein